MAWVWNPLGAVGLVAMLAAFVMAAFVYFARPDRTQNRLLALVLFFEGAWVGGGHGLIYLTDQAHHAYGFQAVDETALLVLPVLYLLFLSTLDTPLAAPFRPRPVQVALLLASFAAESYWLTHPEQFIAGMEQPGYAAWEAGTGPLHRISVGVVGVASLFALLVSLSAWRRAKPGSPARVRAKAFAVAFGTRDVLFFTSTLVLRPLTPLGGRDVLPSEAYLYLVSLTTLTFVPLLAYAILRAQLFDIDVRVRWTVGRSTIAAVFIAAFFVVSEAAGQYFTESIGLLSGLLAAGVLVFFIAPLERLADRLASAAVPRAKAVRDMSAKEKLGIYREQVRAAWEDGGLTAAERKLLESTRKRLGLSPVEAARVETEVAVA